MNTNSNSHQRFGFSTVEMLVALLVMIFISALVVPMLVTSGGFRDVSERRNAQLLAAICFRAREAGVDFVEGKEVTPAIENLLAGGQAVTGQHFQAVGITADEARSAARHLKVQDGFLVYLPSAR